MSSGARHTYQNAVEYGSAIFHVVRTVTAAATLTDQDNIVLVNETGAITITLPPAANGYNSRTGAGQVLRIKKIGTGGDVTIDGNGAETIDGSATQVLATQYQEVALVSDGSNWHSFGGLDPLSGTNLALTGTLDVTGLSTLAAVTTSGAVDLSASTVTLGAGEIDSADVANGAIDEVHMSIVRFRSIADDGALTLAATDSLIELVGSTTGAKAATMTATQTGHIIRIVLAARAGGSYTLACDHPSATSGTVTLDAAGEGVLLAYDGSAWVAVELIGGATFA